MKRLLVVGLLCAIFVNFVGFTVNTVNAQKTLGTPEVSDVSEAAKFDISGTVKTIVKDKFTVVKDKRTKKSIETTMKPVSRESYLDFNGVRYNLKSATLNLDALTNQNVALRVSSQGQFVSVEANDNAHIISLIDSLSRVNEPPAALQPRLSYAPATLGQRDTKVFPIRFKDDPVPYDKQFIHSYFFDVDNPLSTNYFFREASQRWNGEEFQLAGYVHDWVEIPTKDTSNCEDNLLNLWANMVREIVGSMDNTTMVFAVREIDGCNLSAAAEQGELGDNVTPRNIFIQLPADPNNLRFTKEMFAHEIGHNFGGDHCKSQAVQNGPIIDGNDPVDFMGSKHRLPHLASKERYGWSDTKPKVVTSDGTYCYDSPTNVFNRLPSGLVIPVKNPISGVYNGMGYFIDKKNENPPIDIFGLQYRGFVTDNTLRWASINLGDGNEFTYLRDSNSTLTMDDAPFRKGGTFRDDYYGFTLYFLFSSLYAGNCVSVDFD